MITRNELEHLLQSTETFRVERTISTTNTDKFCEAICAFANDMPASGEKGYLLLGVRDDGSKCGLRVDDALLNKMMAIRTSGNILPLPVMSVYTVSFDDGDVLVVEVTPSILPPVRYRGRTFIRVGPRKDIATYEEEQQLVERRSANFPSFDTTPCFEATIEDIDIDLFKRLYLPKAVDEELLQTEERSIEQQMAALRLFNLKYNCPTYAALILFGRKPDYFLAGNYIQYVYFNGKNNAAEIGNQFEFRGNLCTMLPKLETFLDTALIRNRLVAVSTLKEKNLYNFPRWAIRELMMNAVMHRDYHTNTPTKLYQYEDRLEIVNAGGLYGNARPNNFPHVNDYRNPIVAAALKILGYVNMFNRGVARVNQDLVQNGNGEASFTVDKQTVFEVKVDDAAYLDQLMVQEKTTTKTTIKTTTKTTTRLHGNVTLHAGATIRVKTEDRILMAIAKNPHIVVSELAELCGISRNGVNWHIKKMKADRRLVRHGNNRTGYWSVHRIEKKEE